MKEGWEIKKLGEVCDIICGQDYKSVKDDNGKYPIYGTGGIMGYASQYRCPANSVIIGRKGNINNPIYVETDFWNVDTAFGVVPKSEIIHPKFFYLFCKDYDFTKHDVSVTIPSLRRTDIIKIDVPIPPIAEQEKIVAELDCLSGIIEKKKQQLKEYDALAQSIFYEMFGDPVENEKGWEMRKLGEVGELARGVSKHRPRNAPELLGGNIPLIQTGDIANAGMYIQKYNSTYSELGLSQSKLWPAGTLCITIAATIGKCSVLTFDSCFPDSVVGYIVDCKCTNNEYIYYIFGSLQKILEENAPAVAQKNINLKTLNELLIPIPPLSLQQEFASKIEAIEKQKALIKKSIEEVETLFNSRMDYYFN